MFESIADRQRTTEPIKPHPKGRRARVRLTSVFGPYARDDQFGSRSINPMELYHNQVTREQGAYSLRMFHRSWGIMLIQQNISAPCTVLDFPTRGVFEGELAAGGYDIVGISSIVVNIGKVREMCRMVRRLSPKSVIVVGGHVTAIPGIEHMIDADHLREERRLALGVTYEPETILERRNWPPPEAPSASRGFSRAVSVPAPVPGSR